MGPETLGDPAVYKGGAKTGQCRRDSGSPGLHRESSFQKGGPNRILALLNLNLARLPPPWIRQWSLFIDGRTPDGRRVNQCNGSYCNRRVGESKGWKGRGRPRAAGWPFLEKRGCRLADNMKCQPRTAVTFDRWWAEGRPARLQLQYCTERVC